MIRQVSTSSPGYHLDKGATGNATLSGLSGAVEISLVRDANGDGLIDGNEAIHWGNGSPS